MVEKTISEIIKRGVEVLERSGIENPLLDAQLILGKALKVSRVYILTNLNQKVSLEAKEQFVVDIQKRTQGMPVQYITGVQEFMSLEFKVNADVLIPRPDTEILVEEILKEVNSDKHYEILDIGTGSGCIPISLAKYINNALVHTVDISKAAIEVAKYNAEANGVLDGVKFYKGDIFEPFTDQIFDIIVSNPPYIPTEVIDTLEKNVKDYEPKSALDGGNDGLKFYRKIIVDAAKYLKSGGMLFFEIGFNQAEDVIKLLKDSNYADIKLVKDLAGRDRVVKSVMNK